MVIIKCRVNSENQNFSLEFFTNIGGPTDIYCLLMFLCNDHHGQYINYVLARDSGDVPFVYYCNILAPSSAYTAKWTELTVQCFIGMLGFHIIDWTFTQT